MPFNPLTAKPIAEVPPPTSSFNPATAKPVEDQNLLAENPLPPTPPSKKVPVTGRGILQSIGTGLRNAAEGTVGMVGDVPKLANELTQYGAGKLGIEGGEGYGKKVEDTATAVLDPRAKIEAISRMLGWSKDTGDLPRMFPNMKEVGDFTDAAVNKLPENVSKPVQDFSRHTPQNEAEQLTQTGSEFLPGMLSGRGEMGLTRRALTHVIAPTVGTEVGGKIGKEMGNETMGRLLGGSLLSAAPNAAMRGLSGPQLEPRRANLLHAMGQEGIEVTGGQGTGRKWLQYLETGPYEGKSAAIAGDQQEQFNRAALRRAGIDAPDASPATIEAARNAMGLEYDNLVARNNGIPMDQQLQQELLDNTISYQRMRGNDAKAIIEDKFNRIADASLANGGVIPPDVYQSIRSDLSRDIGKLTKSGTDPDTLQALRDFQDSLFDSIGRNGQQDVVNDYRDLNNRYRNLKTLEKTMIGAGEGTSLGDISPAKLRSTVERQDPSGWVSGHGDFNELARGGEVFLKPLPNSGTAGRSLPFAGIAAGTYPLLQGDFKTAGALAGAGFAPKVASSIVTAGPVRRAIVGNALNQPVMFNPVVQSLLLRQQAQQEGNE